jgi:hypothetical protein
VNTPTPDDDTTMQNPQAPQDTSGNTDLLLAFCEQIEMAWNARRDATVVDGLAAAHPTLAEGLYEFFALLIQSELDLDQPEPRLAERDALARQRLEAGGYAEAADIARREGTFTTRTDLELSVSRAETGPRATASEPSDAPGRPAPHTSLAGAPVGTRQHPPGETSETATRSADDSAAGVTTTQGRVGGLRAAAGKAGRGPKRLNFLGLLIDTTQESPEAIAKGIGITTDFLVSVDVLGDRLPSRAREELARRGAARYSHHHLSREQLLDRLGGSKPQAMAASRRSHYDRRLTYEDVVRQSKLSAAEEAFWLSLSD